MAPPPQRPPTTQRAVGFSPDSPWEEDTRFPVWVSCFTVCVLHALHPVQENSGL